MAHKEIDHISGTETTGHVWDGDLKELNTPLPAWWLWIMWATIVWSIGYYVVYPSWPIGSTSLQGMWGWHSRNDVEKALKTARAAMAPRYARLEKASLAEIKKDPELSRFAVQAGKTVFGNNCVACHGSGADGTRDGNGYPSLVDKDWLYGGKLEDIAETIRVGIRSGHDEERTNTMAAYGDDGTLNAKQIKDVAGYVLSLSGRSLPGADVAAGKKIFMDEVGCNACHGDKGEGGATPGAPNLRDNIWLYGADKVVETITHGRHGVMPSWEKRLTKGQIKAVAVYVYTRGGGQ